jgi:hypothetical protein
MKLEKLIFCYSKKTYKHKPKQKNEGQKTSSMPKYHLNKNIKKNKEVFKMFT